MTIVVYKFEILDNYINPLEKGKSLDFRTHIFQTAQNNINM